jgi:mannose-6-phosphate isomerase-like protein (cupin superfamily)
MIPRNDSNDFYREEEKMNSHALSKQILKEINPELPGPQAPKKNPAKNGAARLDHWSHAILMERAAYLSKLAKHGDGSAGETLKQYPRHFTMLSFRGRDGVVELHENFADLFVVLDGRATLVTGGTITGAETIGPGEIRGVSIVGGTRQELRSGDVAHVPAGLPHQMLVPGDMTFTSFVMKIQEKP